jgi:Uma2 family endonuclease
MAPVLKVEQGQSMAEIEEAKERKEEEEESARAAAEEAKKVESDKPKQKSPPPPTVVVESASKLTKLNKLIDKIAEYILRYVTCSSYFVLSVQYLQCQAVHS